MRKTILVLGLLAVGGAFCAAQAEAGKAADRNEAKGKPGVETVIKKSSAPKQTPAEEKKAFEQRRKLIKKLVKQYRKASDEQKPALKEQLSQVVSQSVDAGFAYVKARIAAERENLNNWEKKIQQDEQNIDQIKARRVEELLSGEAERKHKAAQKKWKKQMKKAEKALR